jgi:hypothetical protein
MPFKIFSNGVPLPASDLNDFLMEQSIATFADSAARTAAIVSPTQGQFTYLADTNAFEYWNGSAWVAPSSGGQTLISTTSLTGSTVTLSSIPQNYSNLRLIVRGFRPSIDAQLRLRINGVTASSYRQREYEISTNNTFNETSFNITQQDTSTSNSLCLVDLFDYAETGLWRLGQSNSISNDVNTPANVGMWAFTMASSITSPITSLTLFPSTGNFSAGTALLYGVK